MKSVPQHACDECNEMVGAIETMQRRVSEAKRLRTLEEMQNELSALQLDLGSLRTKGLEMKAFVTRAVAQASVRDYEAEAAIRAGARPAPMFPEHCETHG